MILNILIGFFIFLLGLCIGSFLNCVIYRQEQEKTIQGRSFCPNCKHSLSWKDLFPVFSFIYLSGKCRYCKKNISWQYPLVEVITGLAFLFIFLLFPQYTLINIFKILFLFYIFSSLIILFIYDFKNSLIPEIVLFPAIIAGFIYALMSGVSLVSMALAIAVSCLPLFLIFWISKEKAMGFGDVELALFMSVFLGFPNILVALFLAFFFGAIIGLILMFFKGRGLKSEIPFGPFLIFGTIVSVFWGSIIIKWYLSLIS